MMYFTPLKTAVILGLCLLGVLLCIPNLFPAPAPWLPGGRCSRPRPARRVLPAARGGHEGGGEGTAGKPGRRGRARRCGRANIFYQTLAGEPDQNAHRCWAARCRPGPTRRSRRAGHQIPTEGPTGTPDIEVASTPDGTITATLTRGRRCTRGRCGAVEQSIEIVRRRIDETGVAEPLIARQGRTASWCSCRASSDPEPDQGAAGQDRPHDLPPAWTRRRTRAGRRRRRACDPTCRCRTGRAGTLSRCAGGSRWMAPT